MNAKRQAWEEMGRWGTHKEYLTWKRHRRALAMGVQFDMAHVAADLIDKLENNRVPEREEGQKKNTGSRG